MIEGVQKVIERTTETVTSNAPALTVTSAAATAGLAELQSYVWIVSAVICVLTFILSVFDKLYFKVREDRRREKELALKIKFQNDSRVKMMKILEDNADGPRTMKLAKKVFDSEEN